MGRIACVLTGVHDEAGVQGEISCEGEGAWDAERLGAIAYAALLPREAPGDFD